MTGAFWIGHSIVTYAWPGVPDRAEYRGYFQNIRDFDGDYVWRPDSSTPGCSAGGGLAIPNTVNNANSLIAFVRCKLFTGNAQERVGAAFIIQTMIGLARNNPPTAAQLADWEARVRASEAQSLIGWNAWHSHGVNSYYQAFGGGPVDDAFFYESGTHWAITFWAPGRGLVYAIKRSCANPVGDISPIVDALNFTMEGTVSLPPAQATPRPNDSIQFTYRLRNNGPTSTGGTTIWWVGINTITGGATFGPSPSGTYAVNQERTFVETYVVPAGTPAGTQICRQLGWDPINSSGARDGRSNIVCATVRYDFTLTPSITIEINDGATPGAVAEPGDKVEFIYAVTNSGSTQSQSTNCTIYGLTRPGFYAIPTPNDSSSDPGFVQPAHGCPRVFPWTSTPTATDLVTETIASVPASDANRSICRVLSINPSSHTGGTATTEVCVRIAAKPYLRVYGGDVSAGGGQTTTPGSCTNNAAASIIGWNRGAADGYAAAAVQYAAMALGRIYDVSTSLNNGGGSAPAPSGLAFANTAPSGSIFGGSFGSMACIANYYNTAGAAPLTTSNLTSLSGVGRYAGTGPITLGGSINPNQRTVVYVDGDVLINNNIAYVSSGWSTSSLPLFQLVVRGDIYISQNVTQLDGIYIAQPNGATGGNIHTCANPALPATPVPTTGGTVYSSCRNKLTINGAFIAKRVMFLRTSGSLKQATTVEGSGSANIAEVFNFSPSLWIAQPPTPSGSGSEYDAITSLPPVL